jgi:hypothetical protein
MNTAGVKFKMTRGLRGALTLCMSAACSASRGLDALGFRVRAVTRQLLEARLRTVVPA